MHSILKQSLRTFIEMNETHSTNTLLLVCLMIISFIQQSSLCYSSYTEPSGLNNSVSEIVIRIFQYSRLFFISPSSLIGLQSIMIVWNLLCISLAVIIFSCSKFLSNSYPLLFTAIQALFYHLTEIFSLVMIIPNTEAWMTGFVNNTINSQYELLYQETSSSAIRIIGIVSFGLMIMLVQLIDQTKIYFRQSSPDRIYRMIPHCIQLYYLSLVTMTRLCVDYQSWPKSIILIATIVLFAIHLLQWYQNTQGQGPITLTHQIMTGIFGTSLVFQILEMGSIFQQNELSDELFTLLFVISIPFVAMLCISIHRLIFRAKMANGMVHQKKINYKRLTAFLSYLQACMTEKDQSLPKKLEFCMIMSRLVGYYTNEPKHKQFVFEFAVEMGIPLNTWNIEEQILERHCQEFLIAVYDKILLQGIRQHRRSSLLPIRFLIQYLSYLSTNAKQPQKACKLACYYLSFVERNSFDDIAIRVILNSLEKTIRQGLYEETNSYATNFGDYILFESKRDDLYSDLQNVCRLFVEFYSYIEEQVIDLNILYNKGNRLVQELKSAEDCFSRLYNERPSHIELVNTFINFKREFKLARLSEYRDLLLKSKELFNKRIAATYSKERHSLNVASLLEENDKILIASLSKDMGKILRCTDGICEMFGYEKKELIQGQNLKLLIPNYFGKYHDLALSQYAINNQNISLFNRSKNAIYGQRRDQYIFPVYVFIKNELFAENYCGVALLKELKVENPPIEVITDTNGIVIGYTRSFEEKLGIQTPHALNGLYLWLFAPRLIKCYFDDVIFSKARSFAKEQSSGIKDEPNEYSNEEDDIDDEDEISEITKAYFFSHPRLNNAELQRVLKMSTLWVHFVSSKQETELNDQELRDLINSCTMLLEQVKMEDCEIYRLNLRVSSEAYFSGTLPLIKILITSSLKIRNQRVRQRVLRLNSTSYILKEIRNMKDHLIQIKQTRDSHKSVKTIRTKKNVLDFIFNLKRHNSPKKTIWSTIREMTTDHKVEDEESKSSQKAEDGLSEKDSSGSEIPREEVDIKLNFAALPRGGDEFFTTTEVKNCLPEEDRELKNEIALDTELLKTDGGHLMNTERENQLSQRGLLTSGRGSSYFYGHPGSMTLYQLAISSNNSILRQNNSTLAFLELPKLETDRITLETQQITFTDQGFGATKFSKSSPREFETIFEDTENLNPSAIAPRKVRTESQNFKNTSKKISFLSASSPKWIKASFPPVSNGDQDIDIGTPRNDDLNHNSLRARHKTLLELHPVNLSEGKNSGALSEVSSRQMVPNKEDILSRAKNARMKQIKGGLGGVPSFSESNRSSNYANRVTEILTQDRAPTMITRFRWFGFLSYVIIAVVATTVQLETKAYLDQINDLADVVIRPYYMQYNQLMIFKESSIVIMVNENLISFADSQSQQTFLSRYREYMPIRALSFKNNCSLFMDASQKASVRNNVNLLGVYQFEFSGDGPSNLTNLEFYNSLSYHLYAIANNLDTIDNTFYSYRVLRDNNIQIIESFVSLYNVSIDTYFRLGSQSKNLEIVNISSSLVVCIIIQLSVLYLYSRVINLKEGILKLFCTLEKTALRNERDKFSRPVQQILNADVFGFVLNKKSQVNATSVNRRALSSPKRLKRSCLSAVLISTICSGIAIAFFSTTTTIIFNDIDNITDSVSRTFSVAYLPANLAMLTATTDSLLSYNLNNITTMLNLAETIVYETDDGFPDQLMNDFISAVELVQEDTSNKLFTKDIRANILAISTQDFCPYLEFYEESTLNQCQEVLNSSSKLGAYFATPEIYDYYLKIFDAYAYYNFSRYVAEMLIQDPVYLEYEEFTDYLIEGLYLDAINFYMSIYKQIDQGRNLVILALVFTLVFFALLSVVVWTIFILRMRKIIFGTKSIMTLIPREILRSNLYIKNFLKKEY